MQYDRFLKIIKYNREQQLKVEGEVRDFFFQRKADYNSDLLNLMLLIRPLFNEKNYLVLELPFKDREIGAVCYKGDCFGYTLLNSALPKVNVNFALGHEIYHIFYQKKSFPSGIEFYMNEHYYEYEEEMSANLFSGILLMPTPRFVSMFRKFREEQEAEDTEISLVIKLMSYFKVPYMAVVIRCYELELLPDGETLKELLEVTPARIEEEFYDLWLDDEVLRSTRRDDYIRLQQLVKKIGKKCEGEEILSETTVKKVLNNMEKLYHEIRG